MNIIAAVDRNWGIGRGGKLLVSIPKDMAFFREETRGKVILMGRNTLRSLPGGQPLFGRENIILSRDKNFKVKGGTVVSSVEAALAYIKEKKFEDADVFVIGGESVYRAFLPHCDIAHVTFIDYAYEADRHLPNLDQDPDWHLVLETEEETYFDLAYTFRLYKRYD